MTDENIINTDSYWNTRFSEDWEDCEGPRQSRSFARIAIQNLPPWLMVQFKREALTLADWGCAQGDGTDVLVSYVDASRVIGIDFSSVAIDQASMRYPAIRFISDNWLTGSSNESESFDVVFSSNTLEHFSQPYDVLSRVSARAKKAVVLALPYKELERVDEHFFSFLPENIPIMLPNGFRIFWSRVVDCRSFPDAGWSGDQVILVYADPKWVDGLGLTLQDCLIEQSDVATEIGDLNAAVAEYDVQIARLNQVVAELEEQNARTIVSLSATEKELSNKQAELMKMSDWAYGMSLELQRIQGLLFYRISNLFSKWRARIWSALSRSLLGNYYRYARNRRSFGKSEVPLEILQSSVSDNDGRLIIVFPVITWDSRWQRPQHIVSGICKRGYSVLYLAMTIVATGCRFGSEDEAAKGLQFNLLAENITQIWLKSFRPLNVYVDPLYGDDLHNMLLGMSATLHQSRVNEITYLVQFPGWAPLAIELHKQFGGKIVFDCMDDHSGFSTNSIEVLKAEEELVKVADMVIASSDLIEKKCLMSNPNTIKVKNATEFSHFSSCSKNGLLDSLSDNPIIGYYGAISEWFDVALVAYCAKSLPDFNFVLIGSTTGCDISRLDGLKNIKMIGEIPYKDLPGYYAYFDVCIIPFVLMPLTMATNPVKFYEYLSNGKPVVSVRLPELIHYIGDCYLADNYETFSDAILKAYNERGDKAKVDRRITLAKENSWDARVDQIFQSGILGKV